MRITYRNKLLFTFILYGTLLGGVSLFTIFAINTKNIQTKNIQNTQDKALEKIDILHNYYENVYDKLFAIEQSKTFKKYLQEENNYGTVRELFLNIAYTSRDIMQLRYINNDGDEIIRIDRSMPSKNPYFVSQLQNKSHRYYYKQIMQTPQDKIWHSSIDLNAEHGKIEKPFKAVLRIAMPIFTHNTRNGFIIINIFMNQILEQIISSQTYNIYIVGHNGEFKAHPNKDKTWSNYKNISYNLHNLFQKEAENILSQDAYFTKTFFSKTIDNTTLGQTKIIVQSKEQTIKEEIGQKIEELLLIMGLLILLSIPIAYIFSKTPSRLKEQVDKLNQNLENKIHEKTFELQELNANLEQRIKKEVQENSRKDKLLFHQNKIAALGEMIRNIAHQWRQPLSSISTAASSIKLQKEMHILKDEDIEDSVSTIMRNSQYLSKTIDDFRNFFKTDKKEEIINLSLAIKDDLNILKPTLKNNDIDVIINLDNSIEISTIKNELTQVHLNLISNAKDALSSSKNKQLAQRLIFIELTHTKEHAIIKFLDNAGGIDDTIIEHIFEPYFTTKHKTQGTGIGLFMCEEIISNHLEGSIKACNQTFTYENQRFKGALFEIQLPLEKIY